MKYEIDQNKWVQLAHGGYVPRVYQFGNIEFRLGERNPYQPDYYNPLPLAAMHVGILPDWININYCKEVDGYGRCRVE